VGLSRLPQRRKTKQNDRKAKADPDKPVRGRKKPSKFSRLNPYYITDRDVPGDRVLHVPKRVKEKTPRCPSMIFKVSTSWIPDYNTACRRVIPIPFVNQVGKISPHTVCEWRCHPLQAVASMSATVFKRIQRMVLKRHGPKFAFAISQLLFEVSVAYVVSLNDWIIDRVLGVLRTKRKLKIVRSLLNVFITKLDADQRFVLRQACSQAHWLTSRSKRPRDKSRMKCNDLPSFFYKEQGKCTCFEECFYGSIPLGIFPRATPSGEESFGASDGKIIIAGFEW